MIRFGDTMDQRCKIDKLWLLQSPLMPSLCVNLFECYDKSDLAKPIAFLASVSEVIAMLWSF